MCSHTFLTLIVAVHSMLSLDWQWCVSPYSYIEDEVSRVHDRSEVKDRVDSLIASEETEDDRRRNAVPVDIKDVINHKKKTAKKLYHTLPVYLLVVMVPAVDNRELCFQVAWIIAFKMLWRIKTWLTRADKLQIRRHCPEWTWPWWTETYVDTT